MSTSSPASIVDSSTSTNAQRTGLLGLSAATQPTLVESTSTTSTTAIPTTSITSTTPLTSETIPTPTGKQIMVPLGAVLYTIHRAYEKATSAAITAAAAAALKAADKDKESTKRPTASNLQKHRALEEEFRILATMYNDSNGQTSIWIFQLVFTIVCICILFTIYNHIYVRVSMTFQ